MSTLAQQITLAILHPDLWLSAGNLARLQPGETGLLYPCLPIPPTVESWRDIVRASVCNYTAHEPLAAFSKPRLSFLARLWDM